MDSLELREGHEPRWINKHVQCAACEKETVFDWTVKSVTDSEGSLLYYHSQCLTEEPKVTS